MNAGSNRIAHVLAGIVLGLSSGSAALADDTELFVANAESDRHRRAAEHSLHLGHLGQHG